MDSLCTALCSPSLQLWALALPQLEQQLHSQNSEQLETRVQNDRLKQLNEDLIEQLEKTKTDLEKARTHLLRLRKQEQEEMERKKREVMRRDTLPCMMAHTYGTPCFFR
uniref:Uncharacterized protein n=1 Tax=Engystomops pustulosus TaxID=76066 RepID=A0AAV6YLP8_ENGPU|nr:hypothetical protein GDO81_023321 [Engystomops pustulosus]